MFKDIENFKNRGITNDILHILTDSKTVYFNTKGLRFELFKKYGVSLRGRPSVSFNTYDIHHLKMVVSCKIGHIVRKLNRLGFIEKISNSTWKLIKQIDISIPELYSKGEQVGKK